MISIKKIKNKIKIEINKMNEELVELIQCLKCPLVNTIDINNRNKIIQVLIFYLVI